jgi:hypothetical protein
MTERAPNHIALEGGNMAVTDSNPAKKPLVYDLLGRLNAAFARVHKNTQLLGDTGIFDPQTTERIRKAAQALQADANYNLLTTLTRIEDQDRRA